MHRTVRDGRWPQRPISHTARIRSAIVLVAVVTLAAACSPGQGTTASGGDVNLNAPLRIGNVGPTPTLDPHQQKVGGEQPSTFLLYDRLTQVDNNLEIKPMLATSWEFAADGTYLEMKLREGVTFHDGTAVDAGAVKASLDRGKTLPGSTVAPLLSDVTSIEVVDPSTVRLMLRPGRGADLPAVLATHAGEILSEKAISDGRDLGLAPGDAGSGPYVIKDFKPNESVVFERAPGKYWDPAAAKPKTIEIRYTPVASVGLNALRAGQLDLVVTTATDVETVEQLVESGAFEAAENSLLTPSHALFMQPDHPAFRDARVRTAISQAIDRAAICQDLLAGNCEPRMQPYPKGHWAHAQGVDELVRYAPDKAKAALADAGATNVRFPLVFTAGSSYESVAQVLQDQLAKVGITVELKPLPSREAFSGYMEGRYPAYLSLIPAAVDPAVLMDTTFLTGFNGAEAVRETVTPLAEQAEDPTLSQQERGALYSRIWTAIAEESTTIPIISNHLAYAHSPKVTGVDELPWTWAGMFDARHLAVTN